MSSVADLFPGFSADTSEVDGSRTAFVRGGSGAGLLLLHGFPQTRAAWHRVAPRLARHFTVIAPDLPGYGDSTGPEPDPQHAAHSKRAVARTMVALMRDQGHERFAVAGHDRGARVAYRLALDHPARVTRLAVLDAIPTFEIAERLNYERAARLANWFFLAQPAPLPERMLECAPDLYLDTILDRWAGRRESLASEAVDEYRRCFRRPSVIRAACEDYRAGLEVDLEHDRADLRSGRRIRAPLLVLWAANGFGAALGNPLAVWRRWALEVKGHELDCGHFLMEEAPEEVGSLLETFFMERDTR